MNPSTNGWINKYISSIDPIKNNRYLVNDDLYYNSLSLTGFIYGISSKTIEDIGNKTVVFTKEEKTKINLFDALLYIQVRSNPTLSENEVILGIENFYKRIDKHQKGLLHRITFSKSTATNVEAIINARLQESTSIFKNRTASFLTLSLLYIDVITFKAYCNGYPHSKKLYFQLEKVIVSICFLALNAKENKNKLDQSIVAIFNKHHNQGVDITHLDRLLLSLPIQVTQDIIFKNYVLDLALLAIYDDGLMDASEIVFLQKLADALQVNRDALNKVHSRLVNFTNTHKKEVTLFNYNNPVRQLYKQTSETVRLLILRNKDRMYKELIESKELLSLLGQSTYRELNSREREKVKEQLIDLCKTIPSLTIFLLPGGTLLLPLLAKFIPQLLPSAFDDNRIKKKL